MDTGAVSQSIDTFWGCELSGVKKCYEYAEEEDEQEDLETLFEIRQACLGSKAKSGERNVVQLTTNTFDDTSVTHTILSMRMGTNEQVPMFLTVKPPIKLELVQGNGPVHIVGSQIITIDETSSDEDDEQPEVKNVAVSENRKRAVKRPADFPVQTEPKVARLIEEEAEETSEEEESDEDDEEEEMELVSTSITKKNKESAIKLKKPEEFVEVNSEGNEDDEDIDELDKEDNESADDDDDESSDESEDEEDSDEEEEIEEVKPAKKVGKKVAMKIQPFAKAEHGKGSAKHSSKTASFGKPASMKSILKTPQSSSKGSKATKSEGSERKTPKGPLSIDEVKAKLIKSPNLPKKLDKFNNYMTNNFKITDNNTKKKLWEFVQSNRK